MYGPSPIIAPNDTEHRVSSASDPDWNTNAVDREMEVPSRAYQSEPRTDGLAKTCFRELDLSANKLYYDPETAIKLR